MWEIFASFTSKFCFENSQCNIYFTEFSEKLLYAQFICIDIQMYMYEHLGTQAKFHVNVRQSLSFIHTHTHTHTHVSHSRVLSSLHLLTKASDPVFIQQVAGIAQAMERSDFVDTHLVTPAIVSQALINI